MIEGQKLNDQPVKSNQRTFDHFWKFTSGQGDDYTTYCLIDYVYFKIYYKMMAIDLRKQQSLGVDPKEIPQISFTGIDFQHRAGYTTMLFIIESAKETILEFLQETVRIL